MQRATAAGGGTSNRDWWPNQLPLNILRQHSSRSNPMDDGFDYVEAFKSLDLEAVKKEYDPNVFSVFITFIYVS